MAGPKPRAWGGWIDWHTWGAGNFLSSHSNILLILKKVGALQFTVHCSWHRWQNKFPVFSREFFWSWTLPIRFIPNGLVEQRKTRNWGTKSDLFCRSAQSDTVSSIYWIERWKTSRLVKNWLCLQFGGGHDDDDDDGDDDDGDDGMMMVLVWRWKVEVGVACSLQFLSRIARQDSHCPGPQSPSWW